MCLFHQKAIIRRYITDNPKSLAKQELKELMSKLCTIKAQGFIDRFYALKLKHRDFLNTREENKSFRYQKLRAAYRILMLANLPYLFTYKDIEVSTIPTTINTSEGRPAHLKEKIKGYLRVCQNKERKRLFVS